MRARSACIWPPNNMPRNLDSMHALLDSRDIACGRSTLQMRSCRCTIKCCLSAECHAVSQVSPVSTVLNRDCSWLSSPPPACSHCSRSLTACSSKRKPASDACSWMSFLSDMPTILQEIQRTVGVRIVTSPTLLELHQRVHRYGMVQIDTWIACRPPECGLAAAESLAGKIRLADNLKVSGLPTHTLSASIRHSLRIVQSDESSHLQVQAHLCRIADKHSGRSQHQKSHFE